MMKRVLVVSPVGQDGTLISNLLNENGIQSVLLASSVAARMEMLAGAGAVILAEEALNPEEIAAWAAEIAEQPSWSDLPVIVLTVHGAVDRENQQRLVKMQALGNLVLLERPVRPQTFLTAVLAALRARQRQGQMRDYLEELRKTQDALRKSEKLAVTGRLAASISHEINNPLASVTNLLYLIGGSGSLEESHKYSEIAARELARVSEIVTQTLRFYRESTKPRAVQVTQIVNSALVLYQARLTSASILVEREFSDCLPIVAVEGELRQLILNLIANAADAIGIGGTLRIRVADARQFANGKRPGIRLTIADSGSGIEAEVRKTLFEPFVTTKPETGTGLGLWVSSEIVRKHQGTIQVKSRAQGPYSGTVFSVFLPASPNARTLRNPEREKEQPTYNQAVQSEQSSADFALSVERHLGLQ
ncbi:MAG: ATP-binding protein [Acidobacteriaceae bacterium]